MAMMNVSIKYTSKFLNVVPYYAADHLHPYHELVYYNTGGGVSTIRGRELEYVPASYVLIPAGVAHSERAHTDTLVSVIGFDLPDADGLFLEQLYYDTDEGFVQSRIDELLGEVREAGPYYRNRMELLLQDALICTLRRFGPSKRDGADEKLEMLINYIDSYCNKDIDFKALAASVNYSYDYLRHYFRQKMGISPKQYILNQRIERSKTLLKNTDFSVQQIGGECGFHSASHYIATFRESCGCTPQEFRVSCRTLQMQQTVLDDG